MSFFVAKHISLWQNNEHMSLVSILEEQLKCKVCSETSFCLCWSKWVDFLNGRCTSSDNSSTTVCMVVTVCEIFFVSYVSWEIFTVGVENTRSYFWFVFQMFSKEIKLKLTSLFICQDHFDSFSLNIFTRSLIPLEEPTLTSVSIPSYSAAQVINSAWQHISSFLSVFNDISRLTLQKWLYPTSLHTLTTLTPTFLAGNVSQSAGCWLWLPVSWRCFPWKGR